MVDRSKQNALEPDREAGDGNTSSSPAPPKQLNQAKSWCFTFNNYQPEQIETICKQLQEFKSIAKYRFQEETGESGTPHLQGVVICKTKIRPSEFKLPKQIHWETCRNLEASLEYCRKRETRTGKLFEFGFPRPVKILEESAFYPWQRKALEYASTEPDDRTVHWFWGMGCDGKTLFYKWAVVTGRAIFCSSGKCSDLVNLVFESDMDKFNLVFFGLPRGVKNRVSYNAIESIKDGLICNTKFETGFKAFNCPHVFIFANSPPRLDQLTADRWKVFYIDPVTHDFGEPPTTVEPEDLDID